MSRVETHDERRQEVAGSGQADTSTKVQVTITTNDPSKVSITKHEDDRSGKSKNTVSDTYDKGKEKLSDVKSKVYDVINMKSLMKHARYTLSDLMNPSLTIEKQIPVELLRNAFGLFFLTEIKGSVGIGASMGLGIIIVRKPNDEGWTGPCAIGMGGVSIGFQIGMEKVEHIFILRNKEALKPFINDNQLKLGSDASFSIGPLGRDANIALNVNDKGYAAIYSYSMAKGAYVGSSLEGQVIMVRDDCNEEYYGKKVSAKDILCDKVDFVPQEEEYLSLTKWIEEYTKNKGQLSPELFSNEENRNKEEDEFWKHISDADSNMKQQQEQQQEQQHEQKQGNEQESKLGQQQPQHERKPEKENQSQEQYGQGTKLKEEEGKPKEQGYEQSSKLEEQSYQQENKPQDQGYEQGKKN